MMETIQNRPSTKRAKLHIGALESVPKIVIKRLMQKAYDLGDVQISVIEGEGSELIKELIEHRLDLVVSNASAPSLTEERLYTRSLMKMPLIVAGAPRFADLRMDFPQSLTGQPFVFPTAHSRVRHDIEHFMEDEHLQVDVVSESMDTSLMKTLAVDGHGMVIASDPAIRELIDSGALVRIGELNNFFEEIWLIAAQRKIQSPVAQQLMKDFEFRI
jgi:LysR family transcriptional activator of nhaA